MLINIFFCSYRTQYIFFIQYLVFLVGSMETDFLHMHRCKKKKRERDLINCIHVLVNLITGLKYGLFY